MRTARPIRSALIEIAAQISAAWLKRIVAAGDRCGGMADVRSAVLRSPALAALDAALEAFDHGVVLGALPPEGASARSVCAVACSSSGADSVARCGLPRMLSSRTPELAGAAVVSAGTSPSISRLAGLEASELLLHDGELLRRRGHLGEAREAEGIEPGGRGPSRPGRTSGRPARSRRRSGRARRGPRGRGTRRPTVSTRRSRSASTRAPGRGRSRGRRRGRSRRTGFAAAASSRRPGRGGCARSRRAPRPGA